MSILEVKGLTKKYPSFTLDSVSFSLKEGRITGFIGRNGAGKSTTLKCLFNMVHPDGGSAEFFGMPFSENEREIKSRIGFVYGGADYYPAKKISAITDVTRRFYADWDAAAYRKYIEQFEIDERKTPKQLSQGMRVKYALALALSHNAELLILDEPTSGLDPVSRDDLLDVFLALADEGKTILFSTHITSDLDKCADDIVYIKRGRIAAEADIKSFKESYRLVRLAEKSEDSRLIGLKRAKDGYTAIVSADIEEFGGEAATLEDIMVHMEKEDAQ